MQIYLIRHGCTAGNLEHRYVGTTDEGLTDEAAEQLKQARTRYPVPELVFTSPLKRCVQTAELLYPELPGETLDKLRECEFGEFEYKNYQELQGDERYQRWIDSNGTLPFPGGESREEFSRRCCDAFVEGCCRMLEGGYGAAAFVVHGGTIMAVLDRFSSPHRDYFDWQVKNAQGYSGTLQLGGDGRLCITDLCPLPKERELPGEPNTPEPAEASQALDGMAAADEPETPDGSQPADAPVLTGIEDQYVMKKNKKLRCGYTTGSCAAAAAKAAAEMLLTGRICHRVDLMTPKGILLHLPIEEQRLGEHTAACAVRKFAGDDPDATDGILVFAAAEKYADEDRGPGDGKPGRGQGIPAARVIIDGGVGVGRVTKPGLEQPVGAAAINRVPREMITREVTSVCEMQEYAGAIKITISVPEGVEIGKKTFNPHIGIIGGISILGTSGIVVPMSEEALIASIRLEMKQKHTNGEEYLLITPGNYGADFIRKKELSHALDVEHSMKCSNYVGETVDMAVELGVKGILFVAHIGKFIKVSGGIMNTHSAHADSRAELMAAQTLRAGLGQSAVDHRTVYETAARLLETNTTEEAVGILLETGLLKAAMEETAQRIKFHLQKRCRGEIRTEVILYSNQFGYLGETDGAEELMEWIAAWTAKQRQAGETHVSE